MIDKDFCLSSYIAFRYIWKDGADFFPGFHHSCYQAIPADQRIPVHTSADIDREIQKQIDVLYEKYDNIGILLSGGMDSANLAAYLKPGSHAYTFISDSGVFDDDVKRAKEYCRRLGLQHHLISIDFDDYRKYAPIVMAAKDAPVHSIEPQIYKAAVTAKKDGVQMMLVGESADLIFGGMDKLITPLWDFDSFARRYTFLEPDLVLTHPVSCLCLRQCL